MTTEQLTGPGKGIDRDRWGRPIIHPAGGGKGTAYTRCTTYVSALDDKENLMKWKARMTAIGMAQRSDLVLRVKNTDPEDKTTLGKIAEEASDHAGAHTAATIGTELHALTERLDRGELLPDLGQWQADIDAYQQALIDHSLTPVEIETFVVNDELKIGGTFDRIIEHNGQRYIGDLKTGSSVDWGAGTYAMQLAVYAHSHRYDPETYERTETGVNQERAILIHLPAGTGQCTVYWIDIALGWESVTLAGLVRDWRKRRKSDWLTALPLPLTAQIAHATTVDDLMKIWHDNQHQWNDGLTQAAAKKKASLATQA